MTTFVFTPAPTTSLAIEGSPDQRFPVHRLYCVGRNYSDHVAEMGGDPKKSAPTFFTKPAGAVVESPATIPYPLATENLNYEVELVVCIGKAGVKIPVDVALDHIYGYAVGLDLTRRDLQEAAKAKGLPWDSAKAFDESAPMSKIVPVSEDGAIHEKLTKAAIQLKVNGVEKQKATLDQMIWSVPQIIHKLSGLFHLQPGDLIFTGTPSGVGTIIPGDSIVGSVDGIPPVEMRLVEQG